MRSLLVILIFLTATGTQAGPPDHTEIRPIMGTLGTVRAWAADEPAALAAVDQAFAVFDRVDSLMSTWRDDSALTALNRAAPGQWVAVGHEVAAVLDSALAMAEASGGAYDPTVLPLMVLWGFRGGEVPAPGTGDLAACLESVGHPGLEVDGVRGRARLMRPGMAVDLGGIAKGYALDAAAAAMRKSGATSGFLDLGGNILVFGEEPGHQVGVLGPEGDHVLATLPLVDASVATSGQYENFLMIDGVPHGHILDPRTGRPVPGGVSATVLADQAMTADALATAAVVLGPEKGLQLLESQPGVEGVILVLEKGEDVLFLPTSGLVQSP